MCPISGKDKKFFSLQSVYSDSRAYLEPYSVGNAGYFLGGKVAGAWSWQITHTFRDNTWV